MPGFLRYLAITALIAVLIVIGAHYGSITTH